MGKQKSNEKKDMKTKTKWFFMPAKKDMKEGEPAKPSNTVNEKDIPRLARKMKRLRDVICCQNVNTLPDDRIEIINGSPMYARTLYVSALPKNSTFAYTFESVLKFGNSNVSIFVRPLREGAAIKDLENAVNWLETKAILEKDDANKKRRLTRKANTGIQFMDSIDGGENAAYEVAILVTLYADSVEELNKLTDKLRNTARETSIILSIPYADQERAFLSNLPVNNNKIGFYHLMDKYSVSTLFHYTTGKFGHRTGAIIGRNIETHELVAYNAFDKSLKGYNVVISGTTRAGKSTWVKAYMKRNFKPGGIKFYSMDVDGEYGVVVESIGGVNIVIGKDTDTIINPFEIDIEYIRDKVTYIEKEYLDVLGKVNIATYDIMTMAKGAEPEKSKLTDVGLNIIRDIVKLEYERVGLVDGDPDSLYVVRNGMKYKKELPTVGSWYKALQEHENDYLNPTYKVEYDILLMVMKDYVRFMNGTKTYFDGQSRIPLHRNVPGFNFDLHHLHEKNERPIAQTIVMSFMLEGEVKKNSEDPLKAKQLMMIFDETHFLLPYPEARLKLTDAYRRAAKKNVAVLSASQNINDWFMYKECHPIFTNAGTKVLLRHDHSERKALLELMNITETEADKIISAEQGQYYIISGNNKAFVKLELMPSELPLFDTNMSSRQKRAEEQMRKVVS